jgi:aspartate/methionine/tyrosine aminotransferase
MELAKRMSRLGTETAFEVLAKAKKLEAQGKKIVHLEIGEPDFDTPKNIREKAKKAIDEGWTHYGPSAGLPQVRQAIADYLKKAIDVEYSPEQIMVVPGGKPTMFYTIMTLLNEGDEAVYPNPGYPIYESVINFSGAKAVPIQLKEEKGFALDLDELEKLINPKTKLLILNSPANPTGGMLSKEDLERIANMLRKYPNITVLSDEIYNEIIYDGTHHSIASIGDMKERTVVLNGHSKSYAMTGWRLGYCAGPKWLMPHLLKFQNNVVSCTASFTQIAGIEAVKNTDAEVAQMVAEFKKRRDVIVEGLNQIPGFSCKTPKGAFYAFANIKATGIKSAEMAEMLLNEAGVACLSGTCFGAFGEGYVRFSYANSVENIKIALDNIKKLSVKWADKVSANR